MGARVLVLHLCSSGVIVGGGNEGALRIKFYVRAIFNFIYSIARELAKLSHLCI